MTNIYEHKSNIKHIQQVGPTCGIYASIMILNRWMQLKELPLKDVNRLAIDIFKVVTCTKNSGSNIGEIFTQESLHILMNAIRKQYPNNLFDYEIVSFDTSEIMHKKMQEALSRGSLILFPYCKEKGNKKKKGIMHWGVIDLKSERYIVGQQGGSNSNINYNRSKDKTQIIATPEELFEVHNKIKKNFVWKDYFKTKEFRADYVFFKHLQPVFSENKELMDLILRNIKERKRGLMKLIVEVDMIGRMVIINNH